MSRIKIKPGSARAILKSSFKTITREKILRSTGHRFVLKIDIAKFYNSIYTHSIPWALHTKPVAKVNQHDRTAFYGNAIDEDCRKMQDGQTVGIPIGPDTSRIISEIILSSIDESVKARLGYLEGVRVIDDYHLYFKTHGDLEKGRAAINKTLKEYELELNQSKETMFQLPEIINSIWFTAIGEFRFSNKWAQQRQHLISYFDMIVSYSREFPDEHVLVYAMAKLTFTVFNKRNFKIFQSLLLNVLLIEPKILPYIAQILLAYHKKGHGVNVILVRNSLEELITYHSELGNDFEIAWALWIAKSLNITLSENIGKVLSENMNPVVILVSLDLFKLGLIPKGLDRTSWKTLLTSGDLSSEYWLVAYEAKMKRWLTSPRDYIATNPFFKILKYKKVSFYKEDRIQDISKMKITTGPEYFDDDDDTDEEESASIYTAFTPPPPILPAQELNSDNEDIPF